MSILKKYISPILTVIVLLLFGEYLYRNPDIIKEVLSVNWIYAFSIMGIYLFIFFLEGLFILVSLKIFKKNITKGESFFLSTVSRIGNYLLPMRAGAIFRAAYLKKKYNFEYAKFLSSLYGYYVIFFLINSAIGVIVLLLRNILSGQLHTPLILFFLMIILLMLTLMYLRLPWNKLIKREDGLIGKIISVANRFISGWDLIIKDTKSFVILLCIAVGNILLNILVVYIEFISIGKIMNILEVILYTCISGLSLLISVTPGSLGIREAAFILTSDSIGITKEEIMRLAFLDRGIMFLLLVLCLLFLLIFSKKITLKEIFFGKNN